MGGVRIPDYPFLRQVCSLLQSPLALTSANLSNMSSSLSVEEFPELHQDLGLVFDGGQLSQRGREAGLHRGGSLGDWSLQDHQGRQCSGEGGVCHEETRSQSQIAALPSQTYFVDCFTNNKVTAQIQKKK